MAATKLWLNQVFVIGVLAYRKDGPLKTQYLASDIARITAFNDAGITREAVEHARTKTLPAHEGYYGHTVSVQPLQVLIKTHGLGDDSPEE